MKVWNVGKIIIFLLLERLLKAVDKCVKNLIGITTIFNLLDRVNKNKEIFFAKTPPNLKERVIGQCF
jgi:hypothetical protein